MATFKDLAGREWSVGIDAWSIRVVRERTGFELGKLLADEMRRWVELSADPVLFGSVLFALCADQVQVRGVIEEQFHRGLAGDALADAFAAFERAYLDFCPSQQRALLLAMTKKSAEVKSLAAERAMAGIEGLDAGAALTAISNGSAGGSPASSDSTPAPAG